MNLPKDIHKYSIDKPDFGIFPPIGSLIIAETSDGAGDYLGLYWEIGREEKSPIVCTFRHEDCLIYPEFKSFESFNSWYEETGGMESQGTNLNDNDYFISLTNKGELLTKKGDNHEAIKKLERSVSLFGKYSETWYWLSENYYRVGEKLKGDTALMNSVLSNYLFGLPVKKAIDSFNSMTPSEEIKNHPLIRRKEGLVSGGNYSTPFSINYGLLLKIIEEIKVEKDYRSAFLMTQNYGLLMLSETKEVKNSYSFNYDTWIEKVSTELLNKFPERRY